MSVLDRPRLALVPALEPDDADDVDRLDDAQEPDDVEPDADDVDRLDDVEEEDDDLGNVRTWPSLPAMRAQEERLARLAVPRVRPGFDRDGVGRYMPPGLRSWGREEERAARRMTEEERVALVSAAVARYLGGR